MIICFQIVLANVKLVWIILSMKVDNKVKSLTNLTVFRKMARNLLFWRDKIWVISYLLCDVLLFVVLITKILDYLSSRLMLFSDKHNYNLVNWNYMVKNRCQHNILQIFEENCYIFIFYQPINFKFLQDAISGIMLYIHMLLVNFDYRICF